MGGLNPKYFDIQRQARERRENNRKMSTALLERERIVFRSQKDGFHLVVSACAEVVDFYPTTGLWRIRSTRAQHRGIRELIEFVRAQRNAPLPNHSLQSIAESIE